MIGLAAERVALPPETIVRVRDGYALIETPSRRDFRDGNIIEVGGRFDPATVATWVATFHHEFDGVMGIDHVGIWWETAWRSEPDGESELASVAAELGLEHEFLEILELEALSSPGAVADVDARAVHDADREHVVDLATGFGDDIPRGFWEWRVDAFHRTSEVRGGGHWLAWREGEPVATAGLYHHEGLATVQDVITREDHRGRGIAGKLLHTALRTLPAATRTVVVVAPDTTAASLYRRLGFRPHSHLLVVKQRATAHG